MRLELFNLFSACINVETELNGIGGLDVTTVQRWETPPSGTNWRLGETTLPILQDIYTKRCRSRAGRIAQDSSQPSISLLVILV